MNQKLRTMLVWTALVGVFVALYSLASWPSPPRQDSSVFRQHVAEGQVRGVRVDGNEITVTLWDDSTYSTLGVMDDELTRQLWEAGAAVSWGREPDRLRTLLMVGVPLVVLLALFLVFLRRMSGGTTNILELRKSRARLLSEPSRATFQDVGGCQEAKEQLGDLIDFLKHPERWSGAGVRLPRGVLLEGPPGCGKTLLARAVAGETDARYFLVSASEFVEMFVGVGAARVRDMFEIAAKQAPAVIFIDELDAVGRRRGSGIGAGHDEREQTLNQLLVCLDGFESCDRVVVIGATNRSDVLDEALLRPGRFDRRIRIPELSHDQRVEVLGIHTRGKKLAPDVSLGELARRTAGWSGADLESLANEAGLLAVRRSREHPEQPLTVCREDFLRALEPSVERQRRFDRVDALLIESTKQLSQPTGRTEVRLTLVDGSRVEGELVWADATFVKVRGDADAETIVSKSQIRTLESLAGTEWAEPDDVVPDRWAEKIPDLA